MIIILIFFLIIIKLKYLEFVRLQFRFWQPGLKTIFVIMTKLLLQLINSRMFLIICYNRFCYELNDLCLQFFHREDKLTYREIFA